MELYVKSGPNGEVGDCPFAHLVQSVLNAKKLDYKVSKSNIHSIEKLLSFALPPSNQRYTKGSVDSSRSSLATQGISQVGWLMIRSFVVKCRV